MFNSRLQFTKPSNTSRGDGRVLEILYKPGFLEDKNISELKRTVDKELSDISNAFYKNTRIDIDTHKRIDELTIESKELSAKIEVVDTVSKAEDAALAQRITTFESQIGDVSALIKEETTARVDADSAMAMRIDSIVGAFGGELGPLFAEIDNNFKVLSTADEAISERLEQTNASYQQADRTLDAAISTETTARVAADVALTTEITKLSATDGEIKASLEQEKVARVDADGALARSVESVSSTLGADIASVRQGAEASINATNGRLDAVWGLEVTAGDTIAGIKVGAAGAGTSEIKMLADRVSFTDGASTTRPITIENGKAAFNDVIIRGALYGQSGTFTGEVNATSGYLDNVTVTGVVNANGGEFNNVVVKENCVLLGTVYADRIVGLPTGVRFSIGETEQLYPSDTWLTVYQTNLPNATSRFNMNGLLGGIPESRATGEGGLELQVLVNGGVVHSVSSASSSTSWISVDRFVGRVFSCGTEGGTLQIQVRVPPNARGNAWFRMSDGFLYSAIDNVAFWG